MDDTTIDVIIAFAHRENVRIQGGRTDVVVGTLARARKLAGPPIADDPIVAAARADAAVLATFERDRPATGSRW